MQHLVLKHLQLSAKAKYLFSRSVSAIFLQMSEIWMWSRDSAVNDNKCHVVVGFETAESAERKSSLSGQQVLEGFLSYLDEMFG